MDGPRDRLDGGALTAGLAGLRAYVVGRLYAWPDYAEDGAEVWVVHIGPPAFFLRVIHRPEDDLPSGDILDLYFPLEGDGRFALGNLIFFEGGVADPAAIAPLLADAIAALDDAAVRGALGPRPFDPNPDDVIQDDVPAGFVVGALYNAETRLVDDAAWLVHVGLPPFVATLRDLADDEVDAHDVWASVDGGVVVSHLRWLSSIGAADDEARYLAAAGAELLRNVVPGDMPDL